MKKALFFLFISVLCGPTLVFGGKLKAYLTYSCFNVPAKTPYLETHLSVIGSTVEFVKNEKGQFQGVIEINIAFIQNNEIKSANKYVLNSPETADTSKSLPNFIDQQRYSLPNGDYTMEVSIIDRNSLIDKPFSTKVPVKIDFPDDRVQISDIELLESYSKSITLGVLTKSGYDLMPYVSTFYPENITKFKFYTEIYNSKKIMGEDQKMVVSYYIESYEKGIRLSDYSAFSKQNCNEVNIVLSEFDISKLPSGNYNFMMEVRDKENKIQALQKVFFQRQNSHGELNTNDFKEVNTVNTFVSSYKSADTLAEYIRCLRPISEPNEVLAEQTLIKDKNLETMQRFFLNFWKKRNNADPQLEWLEYYKIVMSVNQDFGVPGLKGYQTDRGRVYLQYGPPSQRSVFDRDPNYYPYEVWEYYSLYDKTKGMAVEENKQSNKNFVFYNRDMATNNFKLLHSNAKNEMYDANWQTNIIKGTTPSGINVNQSIPSYGNSIDDTFMNPR